MQDVFQRQIINSNKRGIKKEREAKIEKAKKNDDLFVLLKILLKYIFTYRKGTAPEGRKRKREREGEDRKVGEGSCP